MRCLAIAFAMLAPRGWPAQKMNSKRGEFLEFLSVRDSDRKRVPVHEEDSAPVSVFRLPNSTQECVGVVPEWTCAIPMQVAQFAQLLVPAGVFFHEDQAIKGPVLHSKSPFGRSQDEAPAIVLVGLVPRSRLPDYSSCSRESVQVDQVERLVLEGRRVCVQVGFQNVELLFRPVASECWFGFTNASSRHSNTPLPLQGLWYASPPHPGISFHSLPSSSLPPAFGVLPPHCLKKNGTFAATHSSRKSATHR